MNIDASVRALLGAGVLTGVVPSGRLHYSFGVTWMTEYSVKALIDFLSYAANKGLLNKATANAKRIAVERIFEVAEEDEKADVRSVELSSLMNRFMNLSGSEFKPESLATYQSRARSGIDEFLAWKNNPMGFRPVRRSSGMKNTRSTTKVDATPDLAEPHLSRAQHQSHMTTNTLPIPIRSDLTVVIQGMPFDLTKAEANKIAKVVMAMASEVSE